MPGKRMTQKYDINKKRAEDQRRETKVSFRQKEVIDADFIRRKKRTGRAHAEIKKSGYFLDTKSGKFERLKPRANCAPRSVRKTKNAHIYNYRHMQRIDTTLMLKIRDKDRWQVCADTIIRKNGRRQKVFSSSGLSRAGAPSVKAIKDQIRRTISRVAGYDIVTMDFFIRYWIKK